MVNHGLSLWGHKYVMDFQEISFLLNKSGFKNIKKPKWRESEFQELKNLEVRPFLGDLILEVMKKYLMIQR
jgi:hypothetical protein